jgi:bis(5'-nucleosyl)-tetraphosphatase (symmetrical)
MVHAGLYPDWSLSQLCALSQEISAELQSPRWCQLLENMYGNGPTHWDQSLSGTARQRFIINSTTRMRFLSADGGLNMKAKYAPKDAPGSLNPWFKVSNPQLQPEQRVIFGHWAALMGHTESSQFMALDTGYVWGNQLTLLNLDLGQTFAINA